PHRVQVRREAWDLQGSELPGTGRLAQVDRVERGHLPEGDQDGQVVEPPDRLDLLVDTEAAEGPDLPELPVLLVEDHYTVVPGYAGAARAGHRARGTHHLFLH